MRCRFPKNVWVSWPIWERMFGWGESIKPLHGLGIPKVSLQWWEDCNDLTVTSQEWWLGCGELFRTEYIQNDGNMIFQKDVNCGTTQVSHPKMPLFFCIGKLSSDLFFLADFIRMGFRIWGTARAARGIALAKRRPDGRCGSAPRLEKLLQGQIWDVCVCVCFTLWKLRLTALIIAIG